MGGREKESKDRGVTGSTPPNGSRSRGDKKRTLSTILDMGSQVMSEEQKKHTTKEDTKILTPIPSRAPFVSVSFSISCSLQGLLIILKVFKQCASYVSKFWGVGMFLWTLDSTICGAVQYIFIYMYIY